VSIAQIAGVLGLVSAVGGGVWLVEDRYAQHKHVEQLAGEYTSQFQGVNQQLIDIRIDTLRSRLWYLQERGLCTPQAAQRECKWLEGEIDRLKRMR
jgi:hypothetical protein